MAHQLRHAARRTCHSASVFLNERSLALRPLDTIPELAEGRGLFRKLPSYTIQLRYLSNAPTGQATYTGRNLFAAISVAFW